MEGTNCGGEGGWTRVAFVKMSQPGATCPTGLTQIQVSGLTLCSRDNTNTVQSAVFTTLGLSFSAVCGRLRGYQFGPTRAFAEYTSGEQNGNPPSIDDAYANGVSITHGSSPRKHIWTYATGNQDDNGGINDCPCNTGSTVGIPPYVGDKYYCESGNAGVVTGRLYSSDPLWDGMDCNNDESTCCTNSTLPWFDTTLSETTNDDLELRMMFTAPLDLIELYIR